jgi:hypothetical protein
MSARRHSSVSLAILLACGFAAFLLTSPATAQSYEAPPPPPEDEAQPGIPPADAVPPAEAPDQRTFEERLSPYGRWVDTPEYGRVWVPYETAPDWQPYTDGHWVDTDYGWSFAASVPWGWATFHYGSWGYGVGLGWYWVPGFVWAPAWVSWRYYPGYVCWTPLAPAGFVFGRYWPGWVVLPGNHFTHPINRFHIPRTRVAPIVRAANPVTTIASRVARGNIRATPNYSAKPNVRGGGTVSGASNARAIPGVRPARGFTRTTFRGGASVRPAFRGGASYRPAFGVAANRSLAARGAFRAPSSRGGGNFAGVTRSRPAAGRGVGQRR